MRPALLWLSELFSTCGKEELGLQLVVKCLPLGWVHLELRSWSRPPVPVCCPGWRVWGAYAHQLRDSLREASPLHFGKGFGDPCPGKCRKISGSSEYLKLQSPARARRLAVSRGCNGPGVGFSQGDIFHKSRVLGVRWNVQRRSQEHNECGGDCPECCTPAPAGICGQGGGASLARARTPAGPQC